LADLKGAMGLAAGTAIPCFMVSASSGDGLDALMAGIDERFAAMPADAHAAGRRAQAESWLRASVLQRFGEDGLAAAAAVLALSANTAPFRHRMAILDRLHVRFDG
jgi:putative protein kinase ArgK-like GTPase of G3E family